ncbi:hypothetical protein ACIBI9_02305 [Nonomuraea sp. NPDC050451]|uniref:hypothetical protein n=1 Tax=Nonomuraea sp. NPDC050451 TaxID=3364364 RepID=UPI0037AF1F5D
MMDSDGTAAQTPARRLVAQADKVWGDDGVDAAEALYTRRTPWLPTTNRWPTRTRTRSTTRAGIGML